MKPEEKTEDKKSDEKPFVIKLQTPSKSSSSSDKATTVHLDSVPTEKIEPKKEEAPVSKPKVERKIESVSHS